MFKELIELRGQCPEDGAVFPMPPTQYIELPLLPALKSFKGTVIHGGVGCQVRVFRRTNVITNSGAVVYQLWEDV